MKKFKNSEITPEKIYHKTDSNISFTIIFVAFVLDISKDFFSSELKIFVLFKILVIIFSR